VADEELQEIENIVNREVLSNATVETLEDVPIDVAVNEYHAMALFGEKYGDKVRVVKLSDGFFNGIMRWHPHRRHRRDRPAQAHGESSVSSGVRRVEAISGLARSPPSVATPRWPSLPVRWLHPGQRSGGRPPRPL